MESTRIIVSFSMLNAAISHSENTTPENTPTLIKPACPRLNSPEMPTVRFRDTAMTMYTQIGTSCPRSEREIRPAPCISCTTTNATMTMP